MGKNAKGSTPCTPQQNGVSERKNRTLVEAARTMLAGSDLPRKFWAEAVSHAVNTFNRIIKRDKNATPHELFFNKKPSFDFREFGCDVFVMTPDAMRRKLDDKAVKMRFLGFDFNSKAYRVLSPSGAIKISRDVRFIPQTFTNLRDNNDTIEENPLEIEKEKSSSCDTSFSESDELFNLEEETQAVAAAPVMNCREVVFADSFNTNDSTSSQYIKPSQEESEETKHPLEQRGSITTIIEESEITKSPDTADGDVSQSDPAESSILEISSNESNESINSLGEYSACASCVGRSTTHNNYVLLSVSEPDEPSTFNQAIASKYKAEWIRAMDEEIQSIQRNDAWTLTDLPTNRKSVGCKWVYKIKRDDSGATAKFKARLVAQGFSTCR